MSVELLELLKTNLPEKTGEAAGWQFEKAHSILHKVREIILFGWSENFSTQACLHFIYDFIHVFIIENTVMVKFDVQGPEHCHIDFLKRLGKCTNNKEVFSCILRWHIRAGHLQYLRSLDAAAAEADAEGEEGVNSFTIEHRIANESLPCELGIKYPTLQSILSGRNVQTTLVCVNSYMNCIMNSILICRISGARSKDQGRPQKFGFPPSLPGKGVLGYPFAEAITRLGNVGD